MMISGIVWLNRVLRNLLNAAGELIRRLRPVVILHRDDEHRFYTMTVRAIVVAVVRMNGKTSSTRRSGER